MSVVRMPASKLLRSKWMATVPRFGAAVWLAALIVLRPMPLETSWAVALLLLSPLVIAPLLWRATKSFVHADHAGHIPASVNERFELILLGAATSLAVAFYLPQGWPATLFCLPWLLATGLGALHAIERLKNQHWRTPWRLAEAVGWVYLPIGAAWATSDRCGYRPLDFDAAIVLLTAVHFHYAGFALPILVALASRRVGGNLSAAACYGGIVATPLVAAGITCTQLGGSPVVEALAALSMTTAAVAASAVQLRAAAQESLPSSARRLLRISAMLLLAGMTLAAGYGLRHYLSMEWLTIARMRALHGTLNAVGFALLASIAWQAVPSSGAQD